MVFCFLFFETNYNVAFSMFVRSGVAFFVAPRLSSTVAVFFCKKCNICSDDQCETFSALVLGFNDKLYLVHESRSASRMRE